MKLNKFFDQLAQANNTKQASYALYAAYGKITRYDVLTNIADVIGGQYKDYTLFDKHGEPVKTNDFKRLVKSNLKFRLATIQGNASILAYQLLDAYKSHLTDFRIDSVYNDINFTKVTAYLSDASANLTVTTNWYPQAKHDNQVVYHVTFKKAGKTTTVDTTTIDKTIFASVQKATK